MQELTINTVVIHTKGVLVIKVLRGKKNGMKKIIYFLTLSLFMCMLFSSVSYAAYSPETGDGYISFDYNVVSNGIVNNAKAATFERNVPIDGREAVKFTPTPKLDTTVSTFVLDCFVLANYETKVELPRYKYIGITYYYATDTPTYSGKMRIGVINPSVGKQVDSSSNIVTNSWTEAYFDFSEMVLPESDTQLYLKQVHFRPFGGTSPQNLTENDVIYIQKISFYEKNPDKNAKNKIRFVKNTPQAVGNELEFELSEGESLTVPENPFDYPNAVLEYWENIVTGEKVYPGDVLENPGYNMTFLAKWHVNLVVPDHLSFIYPDYCNGTVNGVATAKWEKVTKDGRGAVKIMPNTEFTGTNNLVMDGYTYNKAKYKIDLTQYKYLTVEYYYESNSPSNAKMRIEFLPGSIHSLTKRCAFVTNDEFVTDKWTTAVFDFSNITPNLNPETWPQVLHQTHFFPFGYKKPGQLDKDDAIYISAFIFSKEKPELEVQESYMNGFEDGKFRPGDVFTRAQGCAAVSRLIADGSEINGVPEYSDVDKDAWYYKYIGFLYEKGLLATKEGAEFYPDSPITVSELSRLCLDAYAYLHGEAPDSDFGIIPDSSSVPLSRERAVNIINTCFDINCERTMLPEDLTVLFTDVDFRHPAFAQIAMATVPHGEMSRQWVYMLRNPVEDLGENANLSLEERISVGNAKIAELDILEAERVAEIRSMPSMDLSHITGKKIYVSNDGDDSNSGLSVSNPVKTIAKANSLAVFGDAILLKRGDLWREKFSSVSGVTYTAYGSGDKPKIYGSPENGANSEKWTLVYENPETGALIWQYDQDDFTDVGMIFFNDGQMFGRKEIPSCVGADYYVRGQESLDISQRTPFDYKVELDNDLEFFHAANSVVANNKINISYAKGPLYLRCDRGNPGEVFDSIEFNTKNTIIGAKSDTDFDNLCIMYGGTHGIGAGSIKNLTVTNCEIGCIGGTIQNYGARGVAVRLGNGIEVFGSCDGYRIENCYVYECYDAGITHQYSSESDGDCYENNILYKNNVIVDCVYSIEYFLSEQSVQKNTVRRGDNVLIEGNLLRRAGYGFGSVRPDANNQRHIRSGWSRNEFTNFVIRNNVFDRAVHELAQTYSSFEITAPEYEGNIYIQGIGNQLFNHSTNIYAYTDITAYHAIKEVLGDVTGVLYFTEYIPKYEYKYNW